MSTNVPNLKQIGGGHRKNCQKFVDLMWNDPNVECITILQKRVVRLVCGARRLDHTNPLFKQLGILKCVYLVKFKTSIIMFKAYHNIVIRFKHNNRCLKFN